MGRAVLGIDIGGTGIKFGLVDRDGNFARYVDGVRSRLAEEFASIGRSAGRAAGLDRSSHAGVDR